MAPLSLEHLTDLIAEGEVDTVLVAFPDLQGRLMGKRVTGTFFLDEVAHHGVEACTYLLAVDVDMAVLPGFRFANWATGYGDFQLRPDLTTLRLVPWIPRTALVLCDLFDEDGAPVEVSPRRILQRQLERAAAHGYTVKCGTELEFFLFTDSYEALAERGYRDARPQNSYVLDYHILQTTKDEYLIRQIRNGMAAAGVPVEFSKGEAEAGQHEINLRYAGALEMADRHAVYKNGVKEIAALNGQSVTFMAKYDFARVGSSCHVHSSVWDGDRSLMWDDEDRHHLSPVFRGWLGGLLATAQELAWCFAPYVNSYKRWQPGSWAPTAIGWGRDNRTLGFRVVGRGPSCRVESRIPGADVNPYLALAATVAGGLWGIEQGLDPGEPHPGNGYEATDLARLPGTLVEAIAAFESSEVARRAFGDAVHEHLLNVARQEWASFNATVTDWEVRRGFEQL